MSNDDSRRGLQDLGDARSLIRDAERCLLNFRSRDGHFTNQLDRFHAFELGSTLAAFQRSIDVLYNRIDSRPNPPEDKPIETETDS